MLLEYRIKFKFRLFPSQREKEDFVKIISKSEMSEDELKNEIFEKYKYPGMPKFKPFSFRISKVVRSYFVTEKQTKTTSATKSI